MPIEFNPKIRAITQDEFHEIDYQVMELAFAVHRSLGRLCDEKIYQNELAYHCSKRFDSAVTVEPVVVSYRDFKKPYSMDMLIDYCALYELKAMAAINAEHRKQTLQYLLLTELNHGKIVNFRLPSVESEFVSTRLTNEKRFQYTIHDDAWIELGEASAWLKRLLAELITEWGAFLDTGLFYDAVYHFRGGEENVVRRVELSRDSRRLGTQRAHLLDERTAFKISAVTRDPQAYAQHLRRYLLLSKLDAIQWINFNHHEITFKTILREEGKMN